MAARGRPRKTKFSSPRIEAAEKAQKLAEDRRATIKRDPLGTADLEPALNECIARAAIVAGENIHEYATDNESLVAAIRGLFTCLDAHPGLKRFLLHNYAAWPAFDILTTCTIPETKVRERQGGKYIVFKETRRAFFEAINGFCASMANPHESTLRPALRCFQREEYDPKHWRHGIRLDEILKHLACSKSVFYRRMKNDSLYREAFRTDPKNRKLFAVHKYSLLEISKTAHDLFF